MKISINGYLKKKTIRVVLAVIVVLILYFLLKGNNNNNNNNNEDFINPALKYDELQGIMNNKSLDIENDLKNYVGAKLINNDTDHISLYYRNLSNGSWIGINEDEQFSPASLMKVPLMLAYFKKSENDPFVLDQKKLFEGNPEEKEFKQNIPPTKLLKHNKEYTVGEMIEYMIRYSDNRASIELEKMMPLDDYKRVFIDIGSNFPDFNNGSFDNNIRVKDYAGFFRILFNSSYLNLENSQRALKLLSQVSFDDGLKAGIPNNIKLAHKFGERGIMGADGIEQKQLHDCGIIYYPQHPYILCIMTRGYDRDQLVSTINELSSIVYGGVDKIYGNNN
ncbi:class A beta-lactamase-related serine hydrolase [Candidatus Gracilibacteria bacterium]|nr:class A beta-lactamase-related serine hydrolase [Candidatus Gracilibacteria bacterium]